MSDKDRNLLVDATELLVKTQFGSSVMLQSEMGIGYIQSNELMDQLQSYGIVGPARDSKCRDVLITKENLPTALKRLVQDED